MLPAQSLSTTTIQAPFLYPDNLPIGPLKDYELGGIALNDPSQGLQVQVWTAFVDGDDIMIQAGESPPEVLFTAAGTTEVALAFDQNMRPTVGFTQNGVPKLRWFDTVPSEQVIDEFPTVDNIRLGMDDKRVTQEQANDIIMAYTRDGGLYFRAQRDRFTIEYPLTTSLPPGRLLRVGMNEVNRFQFQFAAGADPADADWPVQSGVWEIPADEGFSAGEVVGTWAEGFGFLGFREIRQQGTALVVDMTPPGSTPETFPEQLVIGYPYSARFEPLPFAEPDRRGPIMGRKRRLVRAIFSVQEAANILVNNTPLLPQTPNTGGVQLTPQTGEFEVRLLGWSGNDELLVESMSPYHATIRAMLREYNS